MKAFEKNIRKVEPYVPGEQPGRKVIKLNTNENPYPPAPGVQKAMEQISPDKLRMYPDPTASVLVDSLAEYYGVNKDQVFVGVGSDDVLSMCFLTFFNSEKPILFPDITYSFYKVWADLFAPPKGCPFAARCEYCMDVCEQLPPEAYTVADDHTTFCWLQHEMAPETDLKKATAKKGEV